MNRDLVLSANVVPYGQEQLLLVARDVTRLHRLERTRRDFVANVSHELRTPLTVVRGFLEMLEDSRDDLSEEDLRSLHLMEEQARRMQRIVDDLLLLSRLETDERPPWRTLVAVPTLLDIITAEARALSAGKHTIHLDADAGLLLRGSEEELRSALPIW